MSTNRRARVYVSGPYSSPTPSRNTRSAIAYGQVLLDWGYAPFVPHLTHFWHEMYPNPYETWMQLDLSFVPVCDAVLRVPGDSPGADREVQYAKDLGIPVFYTMRALHGGLPVTVDDDSFVAERAHAPAPVEQALETIRDIFAKKNADYADGRRWDSNFCDVAAQMGWASPQDAAEVLIAVKQARLRSLRTTGQLPKNEAVEDTVLDRAVYAVIALALALDTDNA